MAQQILTGDIGGTNSRLSLFKVPVTAQAAADADLSAQEAVFHGNYKNEGFTSFTDIVSTFLADARAAGHTVDGDIASASFAVAGPVMNNQAQLTNVSFVLCGRELQRNFRIPTVTLINDFVANGYGLLTLEESELVAIQDQPREKGAPIACLGAGTGLGEVYLTAGVDGRYTAHASEGGHVAYAPGSPLEAELLDYLTHAFNGRISIERVVSGKGLVNVYSFLRHKYPDRVVAAHDKRILEADEGGAVIGQLVYDDALCRQAVDLFVSAYGSEVGNVALKFLPRGGLYITGGIAPKLLQFIAPPTGDLFAKALGDKGRLSSLVAQMPVHVVLATDLGMRGARVVAARALAAEAASRQQQQQQQVGNDKNAKNSVSADATLVFGLGLGLFAGLVIARVMHNAKIFF